MNLIRKRLTRWGGGKLAAALAHARLRQYVVSDVIGDRLEAIGSGPAVADTGTAGEALALLDGAGLRDTLPPPVLRRLDAMARGDIPDLPPADAPVFARVVTEIVASNATALEALAEFARSHGWAVDLLPAPLAGEAAEQGRQLARRLLAAPPGPRLLLGGGETTVRLPATGGGRGGRNQELALAAAEILQGSDLPVALLAAGTDGQDGPTDAAGALVDPGTWDRIRAGEGDPAAALAGHDAYTALEAAGDLIRTGPTGTNVMDLVLGLRLR